MRPGASMRACPGDMSGTFVARGACVPLFSARGTCPQSVLANVSFLFSIARVICRAWGAWHERRVRHARARVGLVCWNQFCLSCVRVSQVKISTFSSPGSRSGIGIGRHKPRGASLQFGGVVAPTGAARGPLLLGRTPHEAAGWRPITRVSGKSGALGSPRTAAPCPHHGVRPARPTAARFCSAKRPVRGVCCSCRFGPRVRPSRWLSRLRLRRISTCLCSIGPAWALGGK